MANVGDGVNRSWDGTQDNPDISGVNNKISVIPGYNNNKKNSRDTMR